MCDGRDVDVSIKENYLSLEIKLAPLQYQNNHTYFQFFTNRKKVQEYLVEANCDEGARARSLKSPEVEEYALTYQDHRGHNDNQLILKVPIPSSQKCCAWRKTCAFD
jgi:hypothetical protein